MKTTISFFALAKLVATWFVPIDSIVSIEVDSVLLTVSAVLWTVVWVHVLPANSNLTCFEPDVFNVCEAIDVDNWDNIVGVLQK